MCYCPGLSISWNIIENKWKISLFSLSLFKYDYRVMTVNKTTLQQKRLSPLEGKYEAEFHVNILILKIIILINIYWLWPNYEFLGQNKQTASVKEQTVNISNSAISNSFHHRFFFDFWVFKKNLKKK